MSVLMVCSKKKAEKLLGSLILNKSAEIEIIRVRKVTLNIREF